MRIYLNVPYQDKEIAKQRGCWWDDNKKQWFIDNPTNIGLFTDWMPKHLLAPTKSKPLEHKPFVNTKISSDKIKRINELRRKKTRR